jgi:hypothetical protein
VSLVSEVLEKVAGLVDHVEQVLSILVREAVES